MRVGLHALGIGAGARPEIIHAVAVAAEEHGFATLWAGEHVVMVDSPASRYPYSADGLIAVPADADWLDPMLALTYAAAVTSRIRLATGVLLLPEHAPLVTAKRAATLDVLSGGRLVLGVGIGWSAEEFADFDAVRVYPKPVHDRRVPIVVGGNSDAALDRVAAYGDGWYGFNVPSAAVAERVGVLAARCRERGRSLDELMVAVALSDASPAMLPSLAEAGVTELVRVAAPPVAPAQARTWIADLARTWVPSGAGLPPSGRRSGPPPRRVS